MTVTRPPATISVVICSRNRADKLERALSSYGSLLTDPAFDLVMVDDGSTDATAEVVAEAARRFGDRMTRLTTEGIGLGAARQLGWQTARGELVLFTDDDCYPAADLLERIRECFAESEIAFLGGQLRPATPRHAGAAVITRAHRVEIRGPGFVQAGLIPGANLTVRRTALEAVGGFDPDFGAGTPFPAEDVELVARLAAAGFRGAYDPRPSVYHDHDRLTEESRRRLRYDYDRGRGAYYAKCLGNPTLRGAYARAWLKSSWHSIPHTIAEIGGALRYLLWRRSKGGGARS